MAENRNRDPHLSVVAPAASDPDVPTDPVFPLPRRHRRLLGVTAGAAALVLGTLTTGAAVQALHDTAVITPAAASVTR